jgi:hypothetical protein
MLSDGAGLTETEAARRSRGNKNWRFVRIAQIGAWDDGVFPGSGGTATALRIPSAVAGLVKTDLSSFGRRHGDLT